MARVSPPTDTLTSVNIAQHGCGWDITLNGDAAKCAFAADIEHQFVERYRVDPVHGLPFVEDGKAATERVYGDVKITAAPGSVVCRCGRRVLGRCWDCERDTSKPQHAPLWVRITSGLAFAFCVCAVAFVAWCLMRAGVAL